MPSKLRQACASVVLLCCLVGAPACGARIDPNATPHQVEQAQLRDLQRIAQVVERVGNLVLALQNTETYLKISAEFVIDELEAAKDTTKSPLERRHGVMRALKFVDNLQTGLIDKIPDEDVKGRLSLFVLSIQTILMTVTLVT